MQEKGPHPESAVRAGSTDGAGGTDDTDASAGACATGGVGGTGGGSPRRAVVLLSGGLDSATALAIARAEGYETYALTVRYGQRHAIELEAARRVASALGAAEHREVAVDLGSFGGSALTDDIPVPKDRDLAASHSSAGAPGSAGVPRSAAVPGLTGTGGRSEASEIPVTYVPARNTVLLSLALAWAEVLGAEDIFIGVNALDYSGYPDCRPDFIGAFEALARLATKAGVEGSSHVRIRAPLIDMTKAEIIRRGLELGADYALTTSCYDPAEGGEACGRCDACVLRRRGFEEVGIEDPTVYRAPIGA